MRMRTIRPVLMWLLIVSVAGTAWGIFPPGQWERDYPNLVFNPSFEYPEEDPLLSDHDFPDDWQERPPILIWDDTVGRTDSFSMRLEGPASGDNFTYQPMDLLPGEEYTISMWVRTQNMSGSNAFVRVGYQQTSPSTPYWGTPEVQAATTTWTQISRTFTVPTDHEGGQIRIHWVMDSGQAWVDDVRLEPTSGVVPKLPNPVVTPNGGSHQGPVWVQMACTVPALNLEPSINFTMDGRPAKPFTRPYDTPWTAADRGLTGFPLMHEGIMRVRSHHTAYRASDEVFVEFDIDNPGLTEGIYWPCDWRQSVDEWWAEHVMNPDSPNYVPSSSISHPHQGQPGYSSIDLTGGGDLSGAINSLDSEVGGTIYLGNHTYSIGVKYGKSHVHIRCESGMATVNSTIHFRRHELADDEEEPSDSCALDPVWDFYYKNIRLDAGGADKRFGGNSFWGAMADNCEFVNARSPWYDLGPINCADKGGNSMWFRDCLIQPYAAPETNYGYIDGNYGMVFEGCYFANTPGEGGWSMHTNNDWVRNSECLPMSAYIVFANSTIQGGGNLEDSSFQTGGIDRILFTNLSLVDGPIRTLGVFQGSRYRPIFAENLYETVEYYILDNNLSNLTRIVEATANQKGYFGYDRSYWNNPKIWIKGNTFTNVGQLIDVEGRTIDPLLEPKPQNEPAYLASEVEDIVIEDNVVNNSGSLTQCRIRNDLVRSMYVRNNDFTGSGSSFITDDSGGTADFYTCGNTINGTPVDGVCPGADACAPSVPENLSLDYLDASEALLSWSESTDNTGVTGYRVYRNGSSVGTSSTTGYTDTAVACCSSYTFTVSAYDAKANESGQSDPVSGTTGPAVQDADLVADGVVNEADLAVMSTHWLEAGCGVAGDLNASGDVNLEDFAGMVGAWTPPDTQAPTVPTGLTVAEVTESTVSLSWTESSDDVAVMGYRVFRDSSSVGTTTATAYTDGGLTIETAYTYAVSAFDSENESAQSTPVVATTQTPPNNFLLNPSFEDGSSWPSYWSQPSNFSWDTAETHSGSRSLKVTLVATGDPYSQQDNVDLTPGDGYTISAWMKSESIVGDTECGLSIRWVDLGGGSTGTPGTWEVGRVRDTQDWVYKEKSFTVSGGNGHGRVDCQGWMDSGTGWFDDVQLAAN